MKKGNLVLAALCILLGIGIIAVSSTYPTAESYGTGVPGPGLWPMAISIVMLACAAILLYRTWKLTPEKNTPIDLFSSGPKRAYISMAILICFSSGTSGLYHRHDAPRIYFHQMVLKEGLCRIVPYIGGGHCRRLRHIPVRAERAGRFVRAHKDVTGGFESWICLLKFSVPV